MSKYPFKIFLPSKIIIKFLIFYNGIDVLCSRLIRNNFFAEYSLQKSSNNLYFNVLPESILFVFLSEIVSLYSEDKTQLNKLVESIKTNFNERGDEVIFLYYRFDYFCWIIILKVLCIFIPEVCIVPCMWKKLRTAAIFKINLIHYKYIFSYALNFKPFEWNIRTKIKCVKSLSPRTEG